MVASCIALVGALSLLIYFFAEPIAVVNGIIKRTNERARLLLYHTDHSALAAELEGFAREKRWRSPTGDLEPTDYWEGDIPASLKKYKPTSIAIFDDRIVLECGSPFSHFGIVKFRESTKGSGLKELQPGMWFYAENGRIPSR